MIVEAEHLSHRYGERQALQQLGFQVPDGAIYGVLGPNGSGKSTLFQILSTMILPSEGTARIAGAEIRTSPADVRRKIGVVFQTQSLDKKLTVEENLSSQGHLFGLSGRVLRERMERVMSRLSLTDRRNDLAGTLSGGLRRRVEIAKSLLHEPRVVLMDEPSTGLDLGARRELWNFVLELRRERNITVLLTTHILDEAEHCDRLLLLHQGRKVVEGTPAELKARVGGDVVELTSADPESLAKGIRDRFRLTVHVVEGAVRVETPTGHRFVAEVVEAFPGAIESVAMHKPTLEDVFLDETGATIGGE